MFLLDTNICIFLMKKTYPRMNEKLWAMKPGDVSISAVTVFELEYGAQRSARSEQVRLQTANFLAPFSILPFDTQDAIAAGEIRRMLEKKGTPIGPYDLLIAAQGLAGKRTVVTHNTGEFSRIPGLKLEDWTLVPVTEESLPCGDGGKG